MPCTGPSTRRLLPCLLILGTALMHVPDPAFADRRHHITLGVGYAKLLSDDLKDESLGIDFSNAGCGVIAYRYTVGPNLDITVDTRATASWEEVAGVDLFLTNSFFGPGVRWYRPSGSAQVYLQGNVFYVNEEAQAEQGGVKVSASDSSAGFGLMGGVDFRVTDLLSMPLEVSYLYGKPGDDVSGLGVTVGVTFNFGAMP